MLLLCLFMFRSHLLIVTFLTQVYFFCSVLISTVLNTCDHTPASNNTLFRPLPLLHCGLFDLTQISLTLISSSHGWVRFLMPLTVYSAGGGGVDLLLDPQSVSQHSPTAITSLSSPNKAKTKHCSTFFSSFHFCGCHISSITAAKTAEDVLLRHKSQSFTASTCVILCGCREVNIGEVF